MTAYSIVNYHSGDGIRCGIEVAGQVYDVLRARPTLGDERDPTAASSSLFSNWEGARPVLSALADEAVAGKAIAFHVGPEAELRLAAPLLYPRAVFCAGANYWGHVHEMGMTDLVKSEKKPFVFLKSPLHTVCGDGDSVPQPEGTKRLDWEAELAFVVGRTARHVAAARADEYIAGYTILNDISARDYAFREDWPNFKMDWFQHKNFDNSAPMGPRVVPAEFIGDPNDLAIRLWVNDDVRQDSRTSDMIFSVGEILEFLTANITLQPGDVVATGTPGGTGRSHDRWLTAGDHVRVEIEGIGQLRNDIGEPVARAA